MSLFSQKKTLTAYNELVWWKMLLKSYMSYIYWKNDISDNVVYDIFFLRRNELEWFDV